MYYIDVYQIFNPYTKDYKHVERIEFRSIHLMLHHLNYVDKKYGKLTDHVVVTASGQRSAIDTFECLLAHLGRMPSKSEIN